MFPTGDRVDVLRSGITSLVEFEKLTLIELAEGSKERDDPNSANEWLIDREIPRIYERHFTSLPRGVSYLTGKDQPGGPAINFTLTTLEIMGVKNYQGKPYKAAGIAEIWKRPQRPATD
jgi:hypothetical protein